MHNQVNVCTWYSIVTSTRLSTNKGLYLGLENICLVIAKSDFPDYILQTSVQIHIKECGCQTEILK